MTNEPILSIRSLDISLPKGADRPFAVKDLNLELRRNEILCVVGESGSGKSLLATAIMGLLPPGVRIAGERSTSMAPRSPRFLTRNTERSAAPASRWCSRSR
ncbi:ATP-binding cassette domain-containing protein [Seohaeicola zhoushanensis]